MKRFVWIAMVAAGALALSPSIRAQDCGNWNNSHLRGTYTMSGSGWIDPSKVAPGLPAGLVPMGWVVAAALDGAGRGKGWGSVNMGGVQINFDFTSMTYQVKADCRVTFAYSMKIKEFPGIPESTQERIAVLMPRGGHGQDLELGIMVVGAGPGTMIDSGVAKRISMQ